MQKATMIYWMSIPPRRSQKADCERENLVVCVLTLKSRTCVDTRTGPKREKFDVVAGCPGKMKEGWQYLEEQEW